MEEVKLTSCGGGSLLPTWSGTEYLWGLLPGEIPSVPRAHHPPDSFYTSPPHWHAGNLSLSPPGKDAETQISLWYCHLTQLQSTFPIHRSTQTTAIWRLVEIITMMSIASPKMVTGTGLKKVDSVSCPESQTPVIHLLAHSQLRGQIH